jgi:hypothetical protein
VQPDLVSQFEVGKPGSFGSGIFCNVGQAKLRFSPAHIGMGIVGVDVLLGFSYQFGLGSNVSMFKPIACAASRDKRN